MGIEDEFTHCVRHEEARIAAHADQLTNLGGRILELQLGQGLDRIGWTLFSHLAIVDHETGLTGGRELHHLQPQLRVGEGLIAVGWVAGREKPYFLQSQRLLQLECSAQVCVVNRIEGSAENTHGVHTGTLPETVVACKAPARPPVREVSALHASPVASPLITRSVWLACMSRRPSGSVLSRDSARGEGVA